MWPEAHTDATVKPSYMTSKLTILVATAVLLAAHLAPTAKGQTIWFQISDLGGGNTQWQLIASDTTYTTYTVGPYNQTGALAEQVILPKIAFAFDYSQNFTLSACAEINSVLISGTECNSIRARRYA